MRISILLITPSFSQKGGVVEFNKMVLKYSHEKIIPFEIKSGLKKRMSSKIFFLIRDFSVFVYHLLSKKIDVVHINPSLGKNSVYRDGLFVSISKFFKKKVYVHWHGWNPSNEYLLEKKSVKRFLRADHIKFLSANFADKFKAMGFENKLSIGNTFVDDELLKPSTYETHREKKNLLFLSTISKNKGIYVALEVYQKVKLEYPSLQLIIAGEGEELYRVKKFCLENNLVDISFVGYVSGEKKAEVFCESDIYIFPSFYEGMPTSVLEAMAFGLPIVSSDVGALGELFERHNMGFKIVNQEIDLYVQAIEQLLSNNALYEKITQSNKEFSVYYFASVSVSRIDSDYKTLLSI